MTDARKAMQQALDVIRNQGDVSVDEWIAVERALVAALAQQGEQPVAWRGRCTNPLGEWVLFYRRQPSQESFSNMEWEPLYAGAAPAARPDLSALSPKTQERIREWIADGTFVERAIGVISEQERELMAYEKAAPAAQPLSDEQIGKIESEIWNMDSMDDTERLSNREFVRAIEAAHGIGADK